MDVPKNIVKLANLKALPAAPGIYMVRDRAQRVVYIGQSKNIRSRWLHGHHKLSEIVTLCGTDFSIECCLVSPWLLNRAENAAHGVYKPLLNAKTPPLV